MVSGPQRTTSSAMVLMTVALDLSGILERTVGSTAGSTAEVMVLTRAPAATTATTVARCMMMIWPTCTVLGNGITSSCASRAGQAAVRRTIPTGDQGHPGFHKRFSLMLGLPFFPLS